MAVTYASPGVYVEEVDRGTKPIEGVGTSMPAFVGMTEKAPTKKSMVLEGSKMVFKEESELNHAVLVANWSQYTEAFGSFVEGVYLPDAVYGYFANGGGACYVVSLRTVGKAAQSTSAPAKTASVAIPGGTSGDSFTVMAKQPGVGGNRLSVTITAGEENTFSVVVGNDRKTGLTMQTLGGTQFTDVTIAEVGGNAPKAGTYTLIGGADAAVGSSITPLSASDFVGDPAQRTGFGGLEALTDVRLLVCPDAVAGYDASPAAKDRVKAIQTAMITHCENVRYCFAVLDTPPGLSAQGAKEWREFVNFDTSHAAMYYPWIEIADLSGSPSPKKLVPPSGHMVGVYNRTDADRGVHKAPANDVLRNAMGLELKLSKAEQDTLNPIGVNCIREFPGRGIRAWGARTLSSNGAWRYVSVRRLFIFVEASLEVGLQWVVFEPNDRTLWAKVRRDITSFLRNVWRSGALFGATPAEAFYVKCDEELNPSEVRDLGQLIIEVGLAPVKPAEFVIVRVSQWAGADAEA